MSQNFINHPSTGDITVTPRSGTLACNHVIHTNCCQWNSGSGETVSVNDNHAHIFNHDYADVIIFLIIFRWVL